MLVLDKRRSGVFLQVREKKKKDDEGMYKAEEDNLTKKFFLFLPLRKKKQTVRARDRMLWRETGGEISPPSRNEER